MPTVTTVLKLFGVFPLPSDPGVLVTTKLQ